MQVEQALYDILARDVRHAAKHDRNYVLNKCKRIA